MQKNSSSFPVEFLDDPFAGTSALAPHLAGGRTLIVADMNAVQRIPSIGTRIGRFVQEAGLTLAGSPVVIGGGEKCKADDLESVKRTVKAALDARIGRNDTILALGGGALLDVAGYAAAQLRGGVRLVRMPTTPAAMMDAAFAVTAAVNFGSIKDALKVPSVPAAAVIAPALARTVLDGVWNAGLAEAMRFALVHDAALLKKILQLAPAYRERNEEALADLVTAVGAARQKKGDSDFALWAAARLEAMSDYRLPHGYAVAIGIVLDTGYAMEKGMLAPEVREQYVAALKDAGALDGLSHSRHLLEQPEALLKGLDARELASGSAEVTLPTAPGKGAPAVIDRATMMRVIKECVAADLAANTTA